MNNIPMILLGLILLLNVLLWCYVLILKEQLKDLKWKTNINEKLLFDYVKEFRTELKDLSNGKV